MMAVGPVLGKLEWLGEEEEEEEQGGEEERKKGRRGKKKTSIQSKLQVG